MHQGRVVAAADQHQAQGQWKGSETMTMVEHVAGAVVCRSLGVIQKGEDITEASLGKFVAKFKDQVPADVLAAMRALFKLDDPHANAVKEALINHDGEHGLDHEPDAVPPQAA